MQKSKSRYMMIIPALCFAFQLTANVYASATNIEVVLPGKPLTNSAQIGPYSASWKQLVLNKGSWQQTSTIQETLTSVDDNHWQHVQTSFSGENKSSATRKLNKSDLFTLEMQRKLPEGKGQAKSLVVAYGEKQLKRKITMLDDKIVDQTVHLPFDGFDGFIFGLALSALPLENNKVFRVPAVMPNFMSGYWVDVSVSDGGEVSTGNGKKQAVWFADTSWLNLSDGETYLPGPDSSGGRYVIFKRPAKGQPAVYRYKTDTVDIVLE